MTGENVTTRSRASSWLAQGMQLAGIVLAVFIAKGAIAEPFYVPSGSM
jgi:signal peptidase I